MVARLVVLLLAALCAWSQPARIVSTFPSVTETLFALGLGDRVVGVSTYCRYPPAVLSLPKIGTYLKPDPEKIALLRPDLVIIERSATSLADRLSALGIRHADVKMGSLAEVYSMVSDIGRAVSFPEKADKLNVQIRSRLETLRSETAGRPHPRTLIIVGRSPGLLTNIIAAGPGTYIDSLLTIAGGDNVLTKMASGNTLSSQLIAYPQISLETVVRLNPDVILDTSMMGEAGADPRPQEARLREPWLPHHELAAVQHGMVFGLASETLVTPGPRVADAVELIRAKIRQSGASR